MLGTPSHCRQRRFFDRRPRGHLIDQSAGLARAWSVHSTAYTNARISYRGEIILIKPIIGLEGRVLRTTQGARRHDCGGFADSAEATAAASVVERIISKPLSRRRPGKRWRPLWPDLPVTPGVVSSGLRRLRYLSRYRTQARSRHPV